MSETIVLKGDIRKQAGSKAAVRFRKQGQLPAVIYGHGQDPVSIAINRHDFVEGLHHGHRIFNVDLPAGKETLLVKDLQYDHLGKDIIHADLIRVNLNERVTVTVPIELRGTAQGTHEGGMIDESLDHLEIECVVSEIPDVIAVSIKELGIGDTIHAGQVELPAGVTLKTDPDALVCICHQAKVAAAVEEMPEEAQPEGPEVITERAEAEDESSES